MKVYLGLSNDKIIDGKAFSSLSAICENYGLCYSSALKGKRFWLKEGCAVSIKEIEVIKIKGRGRF